MITYPVKKTWESKHEVIIAQAGRQAESSKKHTIARHMVMSSQQNDLEIRVRVYTRSDRKKRAKVKPVMLWAMRS